MEILLVAAVFGLLVIGFAIERRRANEAKAQVDVAVAAPIRQVELAIREQFGNALWLPVAGRGALNFKPRIGRRDRTPTLSINLDETPTGTLVSVWMSEWKTKLGVVYFSARIVRKKRKLINQLWAMSPRTPQPM